MGRPGAGHAGRQLTAVTPGAGTGPAGALPGQPERAALAALPAVAGILPRCTFPAAGTPLTCAVSGGPDSTALLVLAVAAGCRVTAVHVDHGLRPGSADEAGVVADAARRVGAEFRALRVGVPPGPDLEARARAARYGVLPPEVATGHTMDDQAETVLAHLLRGSGLDGLAAMRPGPEHPLLGVRRAEAQAVCTAAGLHWLTDPTNEDPAHLRNRVRHELLPLCRSIAGREPVPLLARTADLCRDDAAFLEGLAAASLPDPEDARALGAAPAPLGRRAVRRWLRASGATPPTGGRPVGTGGTDAPGAGLDRQPPSSGDVARVLAVARGLARATEVAGGWRVRRSAGRLRLSPPGPAQDAGPGSTPRGDRAESDRGSGKGTGGTVPVGFRR